VTVKPGAPTNFRLQFTRFAVPLELEEKENLLPTAAPSESDSFTLQDGTQVTVRPIRPQDAPGLQALVSRLSPESIFLRFLEYLKSLSSQQADSLANVDYQERMALVAVLAQDGEEQIIAVARYSVISPDQPQIAEVGIVVEDAYQSQGLGTYLLKQLTDYARKQQILAFVGTVYHANQPILEFIQRSGLPTKRRFVSGYLEIEITL
jgi:acetyltransferase